MANNLLTHETFNRIGGARAFIHLTLGTSVGIFELGAVADAEFTLTREEVNQEQRNEGKMHVTQKRITRETGQLTMRLLEALNPVVLHYLFDQYTDPTLTTLAVRPSGGGGSALFEGVEFCKLYEDTIYRLAHPYKIAGYADLNDPASVTVTPDNSSNDGTIPDGTYSYAVVACYDEDGDYTSYPEAGGTSVDDGIVLDTTANDLGHITVAWTVPTGDATPHHYDIYVQTAATFNPANVATKIASVSGVLNTILYSHTSLGTKTFGGTAPTGSAIVVQDSAGTPYDPDTDYEFNALTGDLKLRAGTTITLGETVTVIYAYWEPKSIEHLLGAGTSRAKTFPLTLLQIEKGEDGYEEGLEFYFHRVSLQGGPSSFTFRPDTFDNGISMQAEIMLDPGEGNMGVVRAKSGAFADMTDVLVN